MAGTFKLGMGEIPIAIKFNSQPTASWGCGDWVTWHKALVDAFIQGKFKSQIKYSRAKAIELSNSVFQAWWGKIDWPLFSTKPSGCAYDSGFYNYFKSVGLLDYMDHVSYIASVVTPLFSAAGNVSQSAANVAVTASKTVEDIADTAQKTGNVLKYAVPILVTVAGIGIVWWGYKNYLAPKKAGLGRVPKKRKSSKRKIKKRK